MGECDQTRRTDAATAKLVPVALQKSTCQYYLMVIQQAVRWQMDPFAVAQECSVIQGKLMHSGELTLAVINARGNLRDRLRFEYTGTGDERTVKVIGSMHGRGRAQTGSRSEDQRRTDE